MSDDHTQQDRCRTWTSGNCGPGGPLSRRRRRG